MACTSESERLANASALSASACAITRLASRETLSFSILA